MGEAPGAQSSTLPMDEVLDEDTMLQALLMIISQALLPYLNAASMSYSNI